MQPSTPRACSSRWAYRNRHDGFQSEVVLSLRIKVGAVRIAAAANTSLPVDCPWKVCGGCRGTIKATSEKETWGRIKRKLRKNKGDKRKTRRKQDRRKKIRGVQKDGQRCPVNLTGSKATLKLFIPFWVEAFIKVAVDILAGFLKNKNHHIQVIVQFIKVWSLFPSW